MTGDQAANLDDIQWMATGKVKAVAKTDGTIISFKYDAQDNRISKKTVSAPGQLPETTWYVRDMDGSAKAIYEESQPPPVMSQVFAPKPSSN